MGRWKVAKKVQGNVKDASPLSTVVGEDQVLLVPPETFKRVQEFLQNHDNLEDKFYVEVLKRLAEFGTPTGVDIQFQALRNMAVLLSGCQLASSPELESFLTTFLDILGQYIFFHGSRQFHKAITAIFSAIPQRFNLELAIRQSFCQRLDAVIRQESAAQSAGENQYSPDFRTGVLLESLFDLDYFSSEISARFRQLLSMIVGMLLKYTRTVTAGGSSSGAEESSSSSAGQVLTQSVTEYQMVLKLVLAAMTRNKDAIREGLLSESVDLELLRSLQTIALCALSTMNSTIFPRDCLLAGSMVIATLVSLSSKSANQLHSFWKDVAFNGSAPASAPDQLSPDQFLRKFISGEICPIRAAAVESKSYFPESAELRLTSVFGLNSAHMRPFFERFTHVAKLCTFRAIIQTCPKDLVLTPVEYQSAKTVMLIDDMLPVVCSSCEGSLDPHQRYLAFQTLSMCLIELSTLIKEITNTATGKKKSGGPTSPFDFLSGLSPIQLGQLANEIHERLERVVKRVLAIVWSSWEDPIAAVSHEVREVFEQCLLVHDALELSLATFATKGVESEKRVVLDLEEMAALVLASDAARKGKYPTLHSLLPRIGPQAILSRRPTLIQDTMPIMYNQALSSSASMLLEDLFIALLKEKLQKAAEAKQDEAAAVREWQTQCILPIVEALVSHERRVVVGIVAYMANRVLSMHPQNLPFVINTLTKKLAEAQEKVDRAELNLRPGKLLDPVSACVSGLVHILKTARMLSMIKGPGVFSDQQQQAGETVGVPRSLLEAALSHEDDDIRLDAFDLVINTPRTTELPSALEIELIKGFIVLNLKAANAGFRMRFGNVMKKLISRLRDGLQRFVKYGHESTETLQEQKKKKHEKKAAKATTSGAPPSATSVTSESAAATVLAVEQLVQGTLDFLKWLCELAVSSMYPGCPYDRKLQCLEIYRYVVGAFCARNWGTLSTSSYQFLSHTVKTCGKVEWDSPVLFLDPVRASEARALRAELIGSGKIGRNAETPIGAETPTAARTEELSRVEILKKVSAERCLIIEFDLFSEEVVQAMVNGLIESWDKLRVLTYEVLVMCPAPLKGFSTPDRIERLVSWGKDLIRSPRVRESDAGALLLRAIFNTYISRLAWRVDVTPNVVAHPPSDKLRSEEVLHFIGELLAHLKEKAALCATNILEFERNSPHGVLLALRYIFADMDYNHPSVKQRLPAWRALIADMLQTLQGVMISSLRIIASSKDIKGDDDEDEDDAESAFEAQMAKELGAEEAQQQQQQGPQPTGVDCRGHIFFSDEDQAKQANSQLLVVNSWLSVKEAGLLLGCIVDKIPLPREGTTLAQDTLLSEEQVEFVGDLFLHVLLTTKHNGAIEKTQAGFQSLCERLLTCNIPSLCAMPRKWLDSLLSKVVAVDTSILRRSAGLPFCFLAILRAEPVNIPCALLPHTMNFLFSTCDDPCDAWIPKVHSLNILRYIFQDASLASNSFPYVARGLITALRGFSAAKWPLRNSSLMCYSALLCRSVGAQKDKDSNNAQNRITAREFFTRFPSLHSFLLQSLKDATSPGENSGAVLHPSLYPILLLMSRLVPALSNENAPATEGQEGPAHHSVSAFIPLVKGCASLPHYMARSMAARALVPLVPSEHAPQFVLDLLDSLPETPKDLTKNNNATHGSLMQANLLIAQSVSQLNTEAKHQFFQDAVQKLSQKAIVCTSTNPCHLSRASYFTLSRQIFSTLSAFSFDHQNLALVGFLHMLVSSAIDGLHVLPAGSFAGVGYSVMQTEAASVCLRALQILCKMEENDSTSRDVQGGDDVVRPRDLTRALVVALLNEPSYDPELRLSALKFLEDSAMDPAAQWVNTASLRSRVISLTFSERNPSCHRMALRLLHVLYRPTNGSQVGSSIVSDLQVASSKPAVDAIFLLVEHIEHVLQNTTNVYAQEEALVVFGLLCRHALVCAAQVPRDVTERLVAKWVALIESACKPDQVLNMRYASVRSIARSEMLGAAASSLQFEADASLRAWSFLTILLQDDEEDIRRESARLASFYIEVGSSHKISPLQVSRALELAFSTMAQKFAAVPALHDFLASHLRPRHLDDVSSPLYLFQDESDLASRKLFEKEDDNSYVEVVMCTLLSGYHYLSLKTASFGRAQTLLADSLDTLKVAVQNLQQSKASSSWVGGITHHRDVFSALHAILMAIFVAPLPTSEDQIAAMRSGLEEQRAEFESIQPHSILRKLFASALDRLSGRSSDLRQHCFLASIAQL